LAIFGRAADAADQTHVGDQLQAQPEGVFLAFEARIGAPGRLVHRPLEAGVSKTAIATLGQPHPHAELVEVGQQGLAVLLEHLSARGDLEDHVLAIAAVTVAAHAVMAGAGLEVLLVAKVDQGVQPFDRLDPHIAAPAAVAAVGSTVLDELLAPKRHGARAAVAGADIDLALVEEFHGETGFGCRVERPLSSKGRRGAL
jgi:hypothetical protein